MPNCASSPSRASSGPADIGASNTIAYDRIAEARISYGGRGRLTEVQQPPYGQQILDAVLPF
jgi:flagellar L-ring protein FlgH